MPDDNALIATGFPAGVMPTGTGIRFSRRLEWADWLAVGQTLYESYRRIHWYVGDWILYGEQTYGEQYAQAIGDTGFDYGTLRNDKWIAGRFPLSSRRDNLSWSHHAAVAALPESVATRLLDAAEDNHLTRVELREAVKKYQAEIQPTGAAHPAWSCPKTETCPHVREWRECYEKVLGAMTTNAD